MLEFHPTHDSRDQRHTFSSSSQHCLASPFTLSRFSFFHIPTTPPPSQPESSHSPPNLIKTSFRSHISC
ncbi:hypothetical protein VNO78_05719 [Psophocarpus tetragonolobus]|uniref:Uncharacterized protein n=1 Tax=Psophocarpus tetragonolobus TaxID=3891 RepID=A0AAN9SST5_PSOTE